MSTYLRIVFKNIEPLRIADNSHSQNGQASTLSYIPGTTIRGIIINELAKRKGFEDLKVKLFSDKIKFLNSYIMNGEKELIPTIKGFYEDKIADGKLDNVVAMGDFEDGKKRASLGKYCYIENNVINYCDVETGSDMKIKIMLEEENEKQNVFRSEYILPGYTFVSYIAIEDDELKAVIYDAINNTMIVGNGRSAGLGKCKVLNKEFVDNIPYDEYLQKNDVSNNTYLILLSHTVMRDATGKYCGIDVEKLSDMMGVENLSIENCSTSIVEISGFNRLMSSRTPSINMYEQGSVFKLKFDGIFTAKKAQEISNQGLGIKKNEGFGRILFYDEFGKINEKKEIIVRPSKEIGTESHKEDETVLRQIAKNYYRQCIETAMVKKLVIDNPFNKGTVNNSQIGVVESKIISNRYSYESAVKEINDYFGHSIEKENREKVHKNKTIDRSGIRSFVTSILEKPLAEAVGIKDIESIMGIPVSELMSPEEEGQYKLEYILLAFRYENRKEKK